jgi:hypothetical protein
VLLIPPDLLENGLLITGIRRLLLPPIGNDRPHVLLRICIEDDLLRLPGYLPLLLLDLHRHEEVSLVGLGL